MKLVRDIAQLHKIPPAGIATLGCFDGVHRGHQTLITGVVNQAKKLGCPAVVISFDPYPKEYFSGKKVLPRLTSFSQKYQLLKALGVTHLVCLRFNASLAAMSAEHFVKKLLVEQLQLKCLIVGDDCRFGHAKHGDVALLETLGELYGYRVEVVSSVIQGSQRISSTAIQEALQQNNLSLASVLLGRPVGLSGRVIKGAQQGRIMGFPTANIAMSFPLLVRGVFAVQAKVANKRQHGVANIGMRPTVAGKQPLLEVHLFDFHEDLYGSQMQIDLLKKIREEKKFDSIEILKQQIKNDVRVVREYFSQSKIISARR